MWKFYIFILLIWAQMGHIEAEQYVDLMTSTFWY